MKNYVCTHCGSIDLLIKEKGSQTGLYCGDCGKWIKWLSKNEIQLVKRFIAENKKHIEQYSNSTTDENEFFKNLCKQLSGYIKENYNSMTAILITDSQVKIIEKIEETNI